VGCGRVGVLATPILWFYILINFGQDGRESEVRKSQDFDLLESRGYPVIAQLNFLAGIDFLGEIDILIDELKSLAEMN